MQGAAKTALLANLGKLKRLQVRKRRVCNSVYDKSYTLSLIVLTALIYLGFLHRVLDRMRLTKTRFAYSTGHAGGRFYSISIYAGLSLNIGGALIPVGVAVYLIVTADEVEKKKSPHCRRRGGGVSLSDGKRCRWSLLLLPF